MRSKTLDDPLSDMLVDDTDESPQPDKIDKTNGADDAKTRPEVPSPKAPPVPALPLFVTPSQRSSWRKRRMWAARRKVVVCALVPLVAAAGFGAFKAYDHWSHLPQPIPSPTVSQAPSPSASGDTPQEVQDAALRWAASHQALADALDAASTTLTNSDGKVNDNAVREALAAEMTAAEPIADRQPVAGDAKATNLVADDMDAAAAKITAATQVVADAQAAWQQAEDERRAAEQQQPTQPPAQPQPQQPTPTPQPTTAPKQPENPPAQQPQPQQPEGPITRSGTASISCTGRARVTWSDSKAVSVQISGAGSGSGGSSATAEGEGSFTASYTLSLPAGTKSFTVGGWDWQALAPGVTCG